jgi:hypothetical protein
MGEKSTLRGVVKESRKLARQTVRDTVERIRDRVGHVHPPHVDRSARTVQGEHGVYEVHETDRGAGLDGVYVVHRRVGDATDVVGSFDVTARTMMVRWAEPVSVTEIALVAAAWLEQPYASRS